MKNKLQPALKVIKMGLAGRYKFEAVSPDGTRKILADWSPNVVTYGGLDRMAAGACGEWCQVGTGTATPSQSDTSLGERIAWSSDISGLAVGAAESSPYYGWHKTTYRFTPGTVNSPITEVGIGWASSSSLFSRALITDEFDTPISITVPTGDYLDVTYELRLYPAGEEDYTDITVISGSSYEITVGIAEITSWSSWSPDKVCSYGSVSPDGDWRTVVMYSGNKGAIDETPSGSSAGATSVTAAAYEPGAYERTFTMIADASTGNFAGGIKSMLFYTGVGWAGMWQMQFTPPIPKTSENTLTFKFVIKWYGV